MRKYIFHEALGLSIALLGMAGCTKKGPVALPQLELRAETKPGLNRDLRGDPMSLVVNVYQLKDKTEFQKLTFETASSGRPDSELLGQDLLGKRELVLVPGGTYTYALDLQPGTKFVGLVGLFRKPDTNYWRYLVSVDQLLSIRSKTSKPPKGKTKKTMPLSLTFRVDNCFMELVALKAEPLAGQPDGAKPVCATLPWAPLPKK